MSNLIERIEDILQESTDLAIHRAKKIIAAKDAEIERLQAVVDAVKVSNGLKCPSCGDQGWIPVPGNHDDWYQEQCEFCYTVPDSVFNRKRGRGEK